MRYRRRIAAALLTAGLGISGCAAQTSPSLAVPSSPAAASVSSQPSPSLPSEPTPELAWTAEPFPGQVHGLTEDRGQLVAVGRDADGLASWTSTDGATWARHEVPDPTFIEDMVDDFGPQLYAGTRMGPMTRLGDTLFSFGTFYGPIDFYRPVGWRSSDGASWEFIESESAFYEYGAVTDVATFGDTILAARTRGLDPTYSLWTWTAETSWRESGVRSTVEGIVALITVLDAAEGDGAILAVGGVAQPTDGPQHDWPTVAVGWRSDDAERWDEVALPDDVALAYRVAAVPDGSFSVLGKGVAGTLSIWNTSDGSEWTGTDLHACITVDACDIYSLSRAGEWLVATVRVEQRGRIWLSRDGMSWVRQQAPATPFPDGPIAGLHGEVFVFANGGSAEQPETILLRGALPD